MNTKGGEEEVNKLLAEQRKLKDEEMKASDELFSLENEKINEILKEEMAMSNTIGSLAANEIRKKLADARQQAAEAQAAQYEKTAAELRNK